MKNASNIIVGLLIVCLVSGLFIYSKTEDYSKKWSKVEHKVNNGLPKSALEIVNEIYLDAKEEGNSPQIIKSLIYRISLQSKFQEDYVLSSIQLFEDELLTASNVERQILHSLLAELYENYYNDNRWEINQRATLVNNDDNDIASWDALSFSNKISEHYLKSVEEEKILSEIPLTAYVSILEDGKKSNFNIYPSLFDLLSSRTLNYFSEMGNSFDEIKPYLNFDYSKGLMPLNEFLSQENSLTDSPNREEIVFDLFQKLIAINKTNLNNTAVVDLEIRRLDYYRYKATAVADADERYLQALFALKSEYTDSPLSSLIAFKIAVVYEAYGSRYETEKGEKYRWHLSKAVDVCNESLKKFPKAEYSNACKGIVDRIMKKQSSFELHNVELPNKPILASMKYRNIKKLFFRIIKLDIDNYLSQSQTNRHDGINPEYLDYVPTESWRLDLPDSKDYQRHSTEFKVPALENGFYLIASSLDSNFADTEKLSYQFFAVSELSYVIKRSESNSSYTMFVMNRNSGKVVSGVDLKLYNREYNREQQIYELNEQASFTSNKEGHIYLDKLSSKNDGFVFKLSLNDDVLVSDEFLRFRMPPQPKAKMKTWLFTDRAIYRPGQTVHFKGIVTENLFNDYSLQIGYEMKVVFKDANRKEINTKFLKTNDYGSFNGEFVIPKSLMNGMFSINTPHGDIRIRVEEYKRPGFKIEFDTLFSQYRLGDFVELNGSISDYAGSKLDNASIKYKVSRQYYSPFYRGGYYSPEEVEISNGELQTNEKGEFVIGFDALKDENQANSKELSYTYNVLVEATDIKGETQSSSKSLLLNNTYINISINGDDVIKNSSKKGIKIITTNSFGTEIESDVKLELYSVLNPENTYVRRDWNKPDVYIMGEDEYTRYFPDQMYKDKGKVESFEKKLILEKSINSQGSKNVLVSDLSELKSGTYYLKVTASDKASQDVSAEKYFSIYSPNSNKASVNEFLSIMTNKETAEPGEEIIISFSSNDTKVKVLYEILNGDLLVKRDWISLNRSQKNIELKILESHRGGIKINAVAIKKNRFYSKIKDFDVPFENKKLDVRLETYRNYLKPGQEEEWKLIISAPEAQHFTAEVLAAMYDASLDKFVSNKWDMSLYKGNRGSNLWKSSKFNTQISTSKSRAYFPHESLRIVYPSFNWFGFEFNRRGKFMMTRTATAQNSMEDSNKDEVLVYRDEAAIGAAPETKEVENEAATQIPLRTNFSETAFFFPNMYTNDEGNTIIKFKSPDALTEWKFMALAHTKDLKTGSIIHNIKAKKELMILPNQPRFVRQGDEINFTVKLVNFTDKDLTAELKIEFFDAISMRAVSINIDDAVDKLDIKANSSEAYSWKLKIPENLSMLTYRVTASTDKFSDGEENSIPVLSNRILITETLPMWVNPNEKRSYKFDGFSDKFNKSESLKPYKYTIELTSNPVWYAIQALPYLSQLTEQSTISQFNAYYSNSISSFILENNKEIKRVIDVWKEYSPDAFISNLNKNEELKNAVLEATPWVLESEDETEQKRRIAILFDLNKLSSDEAIMLDKLNSNQLSSGAWPWFNGQKADLYSSQKIVLGFARLHQKGIINIDSDRELDRMLKKAVNYLDENTVNTYERLKKRSPESMKDDHLGSMKIQYLYLRSLLISKYPIDGKTREAFEFYSKQARAFWLKKNMYMQAMISISMYNLGYRNDSESIIRSLKDRSLESEELGMYWRKKSGWGWNEGSVETQSMIIEAISLINKENKDIDKMKFWLLKQKQTQRWQTNSATAEAVFVLLNGSNRLVEETKEVEIKLSGKTLAYDEDSKLEEGTSYRKISFSKGEITDDLSHIELVNPNNNIAWASAYWQYFEDLDKVGSINTSIGLDKKLYVEKLTDDGVVIEAIEETTILTVGQKIISRMIIKIDRDMEFVHLKDMRSSALEPISNLSSNKYAAGLQYYENVGDVATDFYFRYMPKGTYVLEYETHISQSGTFSNGIATLQSMYAPEFSAHSSGSILNVE